MSATKRIRSGLTLVELLVVIAIIGILIGMLLPAVQQVRAAARRIQCANKMRQIGLAVHNYESAHGRFPVNQIGPGESDGMGGFESGYYSWLVPLLPFMEQDNLHSQFDLSISNGDGNDPKMSDTHPNAVAAATSVEVFLCPSDFPSSDNTIMGSANPASSSYVGNIGWPSPTTGINGEHSPDSYSGVIPLEKPAGNSVVWHGSSRFGFESITDGTSNTAMISERLIQTATSREEVRANFSRIVARHVTPRRTERLELIAFRLESSIDVHDSESAHIGRSWSSGFPLTAPTYVHLLPPNSPNLGFYTESEDEGDFLVPPSSEHTGGINLVRADASTSFVSDGVDQVAWWALGARNDGRVETLGN